MKKILPFLLTLALLLSLSAAAFAADGEADLKMEGETYHVTLTGVEIVDGELQITMVGLCTTLAMGPKGLKIAGTPTLVCGGERVGIQRFHVDVNGPFTFQYDLLELPDEIWLKPYDEDEPEVLIWEKGDPTSRETPETEALDDSAFQQMLTDAVPKINPVIPTINPVIPKINPVIPKINPVLPKINPVIPSVPPVPSIPPIPNIPAVPGNAKPAAASPKPSPAAQALDWPANGVIWKADGLGSGTELTVQVNQPADTGMHIKIYRNGTELAAQLFVGGTGSATVSLPGGTYTIKDGVGKIWYGPEESFGPEGPFSSAAYEVMTFDGGASSVKLDSGYAYTITINVQDASPDADSVGSKTTTHDAF